METAYQIKLPLFEGPMDLLLHLIRENKIDIYDIPISLITHEYLHYIEMMKELNLEVAGDFLLMAATLIHIKSRMLLPVEATADTLEEEDPRLELVLKILEYKSFKEAAYVLKECEDEWSEVYPRESVSPAEAADEPEQAELGLLDLNLFDLLNAFRSILDRAPDEIRKITKASLTVKDKMSMIIDILQQKDAVRFAQLFEHDRDRGHLIVTFVALLELIRLGLAKAYQEKAFGSIWVIRPDSSVKPHALSRIVAEEIERARRKAAKSFKRSLSPGLCCTVALPAHQAANSLKACRSAGTSLPRPTLFSF